MDRARAHARAHTHTHTHTHTPSVHLLRCDCPATQADHLWFCENDDDDGNDDGAADRGEPDAVGGVAPAAAVTDASATQALFGSSELGTYLESDVLVHHVDATAPDLAANMINNGTMLIAASRLLTLHVEEYMIHRLNPTN